MLLQEDPNISLLLVTWEDIFDIEYKANVDGGLVREVKAHFRKCILVEDRQTNLVILQLDIAKIRWGSIKHRFKKHSSVILGFPQGKTVKFKMERENLHRFLANTLQANEYPLLIDSKIPETNIICDPEVDIDAGYEAALLKEIEDGLTEIPKAFNLNLIAALINGTMNLSFKSMASDQRILTVFMDALTKILPFIKKL